MRQVVDVLSGNLPKAPLQAHGTTLALSAKANVVLHSVFHTLAYADVFDYPLTAPEVYRYLTSTKGTFEEVIQALADKSLFSQRGEYFTLRGREAIVETRKRRAGVAARLWTKSARYGGIIAYLPFVRMVAITGSLAMNNTDEGKDVDYMIVTVPGHLWICRALALLIARIAKLEGIHLCPNYLVTTNALVLKERSLYVAHELAQMVPLSGMEIYDEMRQLNDWVYDYLPNASGAPQAHVMLSPSAPLRINSTKHLRSGEPDSSVVAPVCHSLTPSRRLFGRETFQKILEMFFSLPFGHWLEKWEMNRKIARLTREQSHSFESYFSADVCKGHIDRHGENVVTALAVRLKRTTDPQGTS
jgi:hypothetical protein